ncbi:MAG: site-specific integrase [Nitrospiraceae bacterium]|nr:site-specific integrase [Nitrospiraceae bacterium]
MGIYKIERCAGCGYKHHEPKPKENKTCPKCGQQMYYLEKWYISYQVRGYKYTEPASPSVKVARDALSKRKVQIREGRFFDIKQEVTFNDAVNKLRQSYVYIKSEHTKRMYENSIDRLQDKGINKYNLTDIGILDVVNDYIVTRQDEDGVTNSTINRELATIRRMAKLCKLYDLHNDIELLTENTQRIRYLMPAEQEALLKQCRSDTLHLAVLIALNTGLRANGVYHLAWDDIDFSSGRIQRTVKGGKIVYIPLTARLKDALMQRRQKMPFAKYVFQSTQAVRPIRDGNRRPFKNACKRAGIEDFRFHDLRHTFATWFLYHTKDEAALQDLLGHSDRRMTQRYAHILDEHSRSAMHEFEKGAAAR